MSTIKISKTAKVNFRKGSAREQYYLRLAKHDGKTVEQFEKSVAASVPSTPKKGKFKGKQEPFSGWLKWFVRNGYCTISES
jgi:hypothetical protein